MKMTSGDVIVTRSPGVSKKIFVLSLVIVAAASSITGYPLKFFFRSTNSIIESASASPS